MAYYKDKTGKRFVMLVVLGHEGNSPAGQSRWLCRCDCGTEKVVWDSYLTSKDIKVKSCGCQKYAHLRNGIRLYKDKQQAQKNKAYSQLLTAAKSRNLEINLPYDTWLPISQMPCHYCGEVKSNTAKQCFMKNRSKLLGESFHYNGIDRVDSTKGYIPGNIVPCCYTCNRAKSDMPVEKFLNWAITVAQKFYEVRNPENTYEQICTLQ